MNAVDRELTAFREAGHALGYVDQRRELLAVSIVGTDAHRGLTSVVPARVYDSDMVIVAALGPIAQAIHGQRIESDLDCDFEDFLAAAVMYGGRIDLLKGLLES